MSLACFAAVDRHVCHAAGDTFYDMNGQLHTHVSGQHLLLFCAGSRYLGHLQAVLTNWHFTERDAYFIFFNLHNCVTPCLAALAC